MKKGLLFLLAIFSISGIGQTANSDKTRQHILELNNAWSEAINKADAMALEEIFADDIVVTAGSGTLRNKAEEIKDAAGAPDPDFSWTKPFTTSEVRVRIYGNVAVVNGRVSWAFKYKGRESLNDKRYTHVYVKKNGKWQIVAQQISANMPTAAR